MPVTVSKRPMLLSRSKDRFAALLGECLCLELCLSNISVRCSVSLLSAAFV